MVDFDVWEGKEGEEKRREGREERKGSGLHYIRIGGWREEGKEEEGEGLCATGTFLLKIMLFHFIYHPARAEGTGYLYK